MNRISFHTPGHKNLMGSFLDGIYLLDLTELPDTDSLFDANGAIYEAENLATKFFKTKRTLISAGGCTLCIQTMLGLCAGPGEKIISSRVIHKSAINTMALLDLRPIWINPRFDAGNSLTGRINSDDVREALKNNPDASAVYITSPDYKGVISDVEKIAQECKKFNIPLLVDNAHGSHLRWVGGNIHPSKLGATMSANSAHKTLPVLTGGAWLDINDDKYIKDSKKIMSMFGSTSPSYPVMASLDLCRGWLEENAEICFSKLEKEILEIKNISRQKGIVIPEGNCDPIRLSLNTAPIGISGNEAAEYFRKNGIEPEYSDSNWLVLIPTPMNTREDLNLLKKCIINIKVSDPLPAKEQIIVIPKNVLSPREAVFSNSMKIKTESSSGRIAAETVAPCPPGIPVIMPGELISEKEIRILLNYGILEINVIK